MRQCTVRRGIAAVLALLLLVVLSTIAVGIAVTADMAQQQSNNAREVAEARLVAESGLNFVNYALSDCTPAATEGQGLLDELASYLSDTLNGTGNLDGGTVSSDDTTITIPEISAPGVGAFTAQLWLADNETVRLEVVGQRGDVSRKVSLDYEAQALDDVPDPEDIPPSMAAFFGHGIASRSKVRITGNASVEGMNSPSEAQVLSATYSDDEAMKLTGNADIEGDAFFSNPDAYATLTGNVSIGGVSGRDDDVWDHVHTGIGPVDFPEVNPDVFEPFAVNTYTGGGGNQTLENIRIPAGANPTISGNTTVRGVVYIEAPNQVHFSGNVDIIGVIVTEDAGEGVYDSNTIKFTGNTSVQGVEALPDNETFSELRQMPGSFLLAPGFGVQFTGNFGTVAGTMAADEFKFAGNAGGTVKGMIINYSDSEFKLVGNSTLVFDRSDDVDRSDGTDYEGEPAVPPGFVVPGPLTAVPDSYCEY
ncbi:MAG: hypothetical protein KGY99_08805 [Phycisphaerae bacterium]|nr:hypothetical protein [Phycisphaerae bacterium]